MFLINNSLFDLDCNKLPETTTKRVEQHHTVGLDHNIQDILQLISRGIEYYVKYVCQSSILSTYVHTYHSRFIPKGIAEASQIFLRDAHVLPKLFSYE
jgi:hypothetical protein